ncbi:UNVERIFIED_CONTAM: regulation of enolase protein 1 (concanavalin A-like superfamily) [Jeotgalibacillus campisalis]
MPTDIPWSRGEWTNQPAAAVEQAGDLLVTAAESSDAWRVTSYGFIHDTEHALLAPFPQDSAMEVEFTAAFSQQFDQAGIFVRISGEHWIKAGVEFADGAAQVGAVVTDRFSDWSLAPVPEWNGGRIRIRISRSGDALTIRAGSGSNDLQLVRVVPLAPDLVALAGPFTCAPTRAGLTVPFHSWRATPPDSQLH